jgi:hypothetical protein
MMAWCESLQNGWVVLAFKENNGRFAAFMVLGKRSYNRNRFIKINDLFIAGIPYSDHCGFVCLPEYTHKVLETFASFMRNQNRWDKFILREMWDERLDAFLNQFNGRQFIVQEEAKTVAPYVQLPNRWETYLETKISKKFKKQIIYAGNRLKRDIDFKLTTANKENLHESIDILLNLNQSRYGRHNTESIKMFTNIYRRCFEAGILHLLIIWDAHTPVAALLGFLDQPHSTYSFYSTGFDAKYGKLSPGVTIVANAIQFAIENNYKIFDFGRGAEDYKYRFGVSERYNRSIVVRRRGFVPSLKKLVGRI